ncbi:MAG: shikimate dehydrogenase [Alphaproteobacteria bacterium]|nr:shikimate dehydrogenase [Alphaproteobacteria bacterium]
MISGEAKLAGVIGWPVSHSRSPRLHGYWLEHYGIDGAYIPLAVDPDDLSSVLRLLPAMGFAGVNITIPHKEAALGAVDEVDAASARIGAVNTVTIGRDGRLFGSNTDGFGFLENLRAAVPGWSADRGPAVVLGAGGAARSIVVALLDADVRELRLLNRTRARADKLATLGRSRIHVYDWDDQQQALDRAALLINSTSLGMSGQPTLDLPLDRLAPGAVVNDIVYVPLKTDLLAQATAAGYTAVDGLGMLLHQARPGFEAWFGRRPAVTDTLRAFVLSDLAE